MVFWHYLVQSILCLVVIYVIHTAFLYVTNKTTQKKTKYVVDFQIEKYKALLEEELQTNRFQNHDCAEEEETDLTAFLHAEMTKTK